VGEVIGVGDEEVEAGALDRFSGIRSSLLARSGHDTIDLSSLDLGFMAFAIQTRSTYVVALAIVVGVALTPGIASAGCGDHVLIINKSQDVAGVLYPAERGEKRPLTPCSEPDCSSEPVSPGMPSGFPVSNATELKSSAACEENVRDARDDSSWVSTILNDEMPSRCDNSIFHPPRR
jgi:hypothetical protein